jgi:putative ABC transport system ATP-binding protein
MSLRIENLKKTYVGPDGSAVPVIDISRMQVDDGQQVALVGSSGSGKTTLLHLIAGIVTADSGRIIHRFTGAEGTEAGGVDLTGLSEARRDVFRGRYLGYIFQTHHLLAGFTALENVLLGMSFTGRRVDRPWAAHLLERVGLQDRLDYKPEKLSVGQQQRVAVARALANRPRLVLADEPTGALDHNNAQQVLELILALCAEASASLLLVTHDSRISGQFPQVLHLADLNGNASSGPSPSADPQLIS